MILSAVVADVRSKRYSRLGRHCHVSGPRPREPVLKLVAYVLAIVLALAGLLSLFAASQANFVPRMIVGIVCLGASLALLKLARMQPSIHKHLHEMKVDMSGDVSLEQIQCKQCGGELSSKSVTMAEGAVFVKCEYCGAQYQLEEQAKW